MTTLTSITPRQAWLALLAVCTLSYVSYLAQRYLAPAADGLWTAALGGLYSSTATTVVLARQAKADALVRKHAEAGITLATSIMYIRVLAIVAIFNLTLARELALPLLSLSLAALVICLLQYRFRPTLPKDLESALANRNPLELGTAALFALLFVLTSLLSAWVTREFGIKGVFSLAAIIGVTDIDPFVLNLAQGGTTGVPAGAIAAAIFIATSSNNLLKAAYAALFGGGRAMALSAAGLVALALGGIAIATHMNSW